jgi:hypothetical protein
MICMCICFVVRNYQDELSLKTPPLFFTTLLQIVSGLSIDQMASVRRAYEPAFQTLLSQAVCDMDKDVSL